ncbi:MAG TPA: hypothetical protein VFP39_11820 [Gemmatimonadales bacterium]|nr:hypothetical protein [Gemmatimonadales bacterium]
MRPHAGTVLFAFVLLAPATSLAQQPLHVDSTRIILAPPAVQVREPMVLALIKDSLTSTTAALLAPARMVAESLGFTMLPVLIGDLRVVDSRYHAIYSLPSDILGGYFIIIPGHRPDVVREFVEPDSLRKRLTRYRALAGPLGVR